VGRLEHYRALLGRLEALDRAYLNLLASAQGRSEVERHVEAYLSSVSRALEGWLNGSSAAEQLVFKSSFHQVP